MATIFYTSDDLLVRRTAIARWICNQVSKLINHFSYGELLFQEESMNLQYIIASLEAISCYTPITVTTDDGVANCLSESDLDKFFINITKITGLCFLPKGSTYQDAPPADPVVLGPIQLGGGNWTLADGNLLTIGHSTTSLN